MKIKVLARFVEGGVRVRHPGEVLDVSPETAERLVERGIAKLLKPPKPKKEKEEEEGGQQNG